MTGALESPAERKQTDEAFDPRSQLAAIAIATFLSLCYIFLTAPVVENRPRAGNQLKGVSYPSSFMVACLLVVGLGFMGTVDSFRAFLPSAIVQWARRGHGSSVT